MSYKLIKADGIILSTGGSVGGDTNLTYTPSANQGQVNSSTGTDAIIPATDETNAGLFLPAEKTKLAGIEAGAKVNVNADWNSVSGDSQILNKPTIITDHTELSNIGTNTHAQIDTHIANTSNPHSVTKTQVGLSNVDNTSDLNKPISTATQTALNNKQDTLISGTNIKTINSTSILGSGDIVISGGSGAVDSVNGQTGVVVLDADDISDDSTINKFTTSSDISKLAGIEAGAEVNNISDINATDLTDGGDTILHTHDSRYYTESEADTLLLGKQDTLVSGTNIKTINSTTLLGSGDIAVEPTITAGTTAQYYRGDKTFQTLDKTAVGLSNVDNTSDLNKPISTATQTALNEKVSSDVTGVSGADAITNIISLTTAEYTAIGSPVTTVLYIITDAT